jgi:uncharacterized repeat protein (TIGR01451 family)
MYNNKTYVGYLGNKWSDYSGIDLNGDGIGDTQYNIAENNWDFYPLMQPIDNYLILPIGTQCMMSETAFTTDSLFESISTQYAIGNATIIGILNGTINFSDFHIVTITSGPFTGKGFYRGNWSATIESLNYNGTWLGNVYQKNEGRKIYLKGIILGECKGLIDGYLFESINGSNVYDHLYGYWTVSQIESTLYYANLTLNGTIFYEGISHNSSEFYVLQTQIEGQASGYYNKTIEMVITHVRIINQSNPYYGQGFSIIFYSTNFGTGMGWTTDHITSSNITEMNGQFSDPLLGIVSGILDERGSQRNLSMSIERIDIGLPPRVDLNVVIWGPERLSPGANINEIILYRNNGLKAANNITIISELPSQVRYTTNTEGVYSPESHEILWHYDSIPPHSSGYLTSSGTLSWGLPSGTNLETIVTIPKEIIQIPTDPTTEITYDFAGSTQNHITGTAYLSDSTQSAEVDFWSTIETANGFSEATWDFMQIADDTYETTLISTYYTDNWYRVKLGLTVTSIATDIALGANDYIRALEDDSNDRFMLDTFHTLGLLTNHYEEAIAKQDTIFMTKAFGPQIASHIPQIGSLAQFVVNIAVNDVADYESPAGKLRLLNMMMLDNPDSAPTSQAELDELIKEMKNENSKALNSHRKTIVVARDPNLKYGPEGKIEPDQKLNYTIEYENEGNGSAFGVYFSDTLDDNLNDSTLEIGPVISKNNNSMIAPPGIYNPISRTITWFVGEVSPSQGGYANLSININNNVTEGTTVINYATVYFPSVPEVTQTNAIISIMDVTPPRYSNVEQNSSQVTAGENVIVSSFWNDEGLLNNSHLEINNNGTWHNYSYSRLYGQQSWSNFTIWTNQSGTHYWRISTDDIVGNQNDTPIFSFNVLPPPNNIPYIPSNPEPENNSYGIQINKNLSWVGGDPDVDDTVIYDIFFGTTSPPPIIAANQTNTTYVLPRLNYSTVYYWKIVSRDNHGAIANGSIWQFTTILDTTPPITTIFFNGTIGENSWYITPLMILLTATDDLSGVNYTMYKLDTANWKIYTNPITISDDNQHSIHYFSVDYTGNIEEFQYQYFYIDQTPPMTTHSFSGDIGLNGWYISSVTFFLTAIDNTSGVNHTLYKIDVTEWIEYTTPLILSTDGTYALKYYSIDLAGNVEPVNGPFTIKIDQSLPSITLTKEKIGFNQVKFNAEVSDETSGIERVEFILDGVLQSNDTQAPYEWIWTGIGDHQVTATAYDMAGNSQSQSMSTPYDLILGMPSVKFQFIRQFLELGLLLSTPIQQE